ncbi:hypothetical protein AAULR_23636, partial [Lacticaseibacillus rhamnosus MTCC 5462]
MVVSPISNAATSINLLMEGLVMLEQSTMHPVVWINQHTYISIVKN